MCVWNDTLSLSGEALGFAVLQEQVLQTQVLVWDPVCLQVLRLAAEAGSTAGAHKPQALPEA